MNGSRLLRQSAIRAFALFIVKLIGLTGRVILTRIVGAEGIGLYQIAYSFYGFVLMFTGGLPTTLAMASAKKPAQSWSLLKIISLGVILFGGIVSLAVFWHALAISRFLGNPGLEYSIRSLAPSLFAVPLLGLVRGYLQGHKQIGVIALSEIIEQASRIFFMLLIVWHVLPLGINRAIGSGLYGTFIGALSAFSLLTVYISVNKTSLPYSTSYSVQSLPIFWFIQSSLMISATRLIIPASEFIDAVLIPNRLLAAGYSTSEATSMYGVIYGMAVIVAYAPTLLTGALCHTLSVQIAAEWQQGNTQRFNSLSATAFKVCWLWGIATALFLKGNAPELSLFIFNTETAGPAIKYLAAIPLLVGFREISTSILWSQDIRKSPFYGLLTGIICATSAQYFLVGIPGFGYKGAAIAILLLEAVASLWNLQALRFKIDQLSTILFGLLCDLIVLSVALFGVRQLSQSFPGTPAGFGRFLFAALLYFLVAGFYMYLRCMRKRK
ncbi:oligosaccharide flippase family protein [Paenibacillus sonchi]|uniref:Oligosaccharide flippase family protein n=1 Tax=Paenibacillus sonchi TaxID=373687 RepID=A0A974P9B2_9BACL|nr:oligosaccharide flippase family protein [Paenibacillus sonchi]QQZ59491.1 oligosaccharide flippase family protein [Paenibacillus sonchi]